MAVERMWRLKIYFVLQSALDLKRFAEKIQHHELVDCALFAIFELENIIKEKIRRDAV